MVKQDSRHCLQKTAVPTKNKGIQMNCSGYSDKGEDIASSPSFVAVTRCRHCDRGSQIGRHIRITWRACQHRGWWSKVGPEKSVFLTCSPWTQRFGPTRAETTELGEVGKKEKTVPSEKIIGAKAWISSLRSPVSLTLRITKKQKWQFGIFLYVPVLKEFTERAVDSSDLYHALYFTPGLYTTYF